MALWLGSLVGVEKKAAAHADNNNEAAASIAVYAAESVDSLRVDMARLARRIAVLETAAGGDRLAEARKSIAHPHARKKDKGWWPF